MADLFNNTSNDYVNPTFAPCAGTADSYTFEFLPNDQVGIVSGSSIIAAMDLSKVSQAVEGWVQQTKTLQPGEVTYIQGLTKGITQESQYFPFIGTVADPVGSDHSLYMSVDMSINYYKNFRYYSIDVSVSADTSNQISIENAINIKFGELGIDITSSYDPSGLTFVGNSAGYNFDITSLDVSIWDSVAAFYGEVVVPEDTTSYIPAFKYPNGAMLGYVLTVTYSSTSLPENDFVMLNHVPDYLEYFEPSTGSGYVRYYSAVDVGMSGGSCTTDNVMSAADYLDYVQTNGKWEKVGLIKIWLTAPDPVGSNVENLITGFYVFNPQLDAVKIDYMTIL